MRCPFSTPLWSTLMTFSLPRLCLSLFALLLPLQGIWAQVPDGIPAESDNSPARIRIPLQVVEEAGKRATEKSDSKKEDAADEIAAMALAARAPGFIPPGTGSLLRIGMPIRVSLTVQGKIEFATDTQRITESGKIGLPLLQNIEVANKSIDQVEKDITTAYQAFYRTPLVNVEFMGDQTNPQLCPWGYVTVMGRVGSPGPIAVPPTRNLTVSATLKLAGGTPDLANRSSIRVFRPQPEDKSVERIRVDLDNVASRGNHAGDIVVEPGDVIYVPERIF